jgi:hypothetical protein
MADLRPTGGRSRAAEFFAGIGLVRRALEEAGVDVVFANDIEAFKRDLYVANFGEGRGRADKRKLGELLGLPYIPWGWTLFAHGGLYMRSSPSSSEGSCSPPGFSGS